MWPKSKKERKKESPKEGMIWHIPGEAETSGAGVKSGRAIVMKLERKVGVRESRALGVF